MYNGSKESATEAKEALTQLEALQTTMNTLLAKVKAMASADEDV